ncbi:MAG: ABC-type amino acid transport substrate-binding protein [Hydrocarboniphaga sp.]|uniref:substrate-binding periplasmic protein n=1 Tax=Hydrocarboniphaga sp. TaxID=2033016 RepID=UPI00260FB183|nr:transporter substrate-binding domain-containing protein [Hydrocarboniphaga sp.]MDB5970259.1 ABC-type amino acid transport substrate-binding protein [Hydrocarboniphaga sp.]
MKRYSAVCASLLMLGFALPALPADEQGEPVLDQLDQARERGGLEVAVYRDFPPYSYQDQGRYTGVDVDLAGALARQLGLTLRLRPISAGDDTDDDLRNNIWKGHYLGGGVADLMLHVGMDPEYVKRQDKAELIAPYFHEAVSIAYRPGRYRNMTTPLSLVGTKVGVELGSISDYYMSGAYGGRLRTSAERLPTATAAVQAFANDEVDAVMAPRGELQGLLKQLGGPAIETRSTELQGLYRTAWDVGIAIKAGNPKLKAALLAALSQLQQSGELQKIFAQYGIDYVAPEMAAPIRP